MWYKVAGSVELVARPVRVKMTVSLSTINRKCLELLPVFLHFEISIRLFMFRAGMLTLTQFRPEDSEVQLFMLSRNRARQQDSLPARLAACIILVTAVLVPLTGCQYRTLRQDVGTDHYETQTLHSGIDIPVTDEDVEFVREYTYRASEDDSRNASRRKALDQIKVQLSEEIGIYIESYLEINKIVSADVTRNDVSHEIKTLSSNITRLNILDEKWDGKTYYVRASVSTSPQQAVASLLEAIKAKSAKSEIDRLNLIIKEQEAQINKSKEKAAELQKELLRQELLYETRQSERIQTKNELIRTREEQRLQERLLAEDRKQLERIKKIVKDSKVKRERIAKKACLIEKGMTRIEVEDAIGKPEYGGVNDSVYHYGNIRILFNYPTSRVYAVRGCRYL